MSFTRTMAVASRGLQGWRGEVGGEQASVLTTSSGKANGRGAEKVGFPRV